MILDPSGRGPSMRQLIAAGAVGMLVLSAGLVLLMKRYHGDFTEKVNIVADLTTTGDGLPADADVKFRGVLVGSVKSVEVAALGEIQQVHIAMKPQYAGDIPSSVTGRVVPVNVFGVGAVELLDNGPGPGLHEGARINQDRSQTTVQLQTTLNTVRSVLDRIDPAKAGRILTTLSAALDPKARVPGSTVERLDRWITTVRASIPDFGADLDNFANASRALNQSAPELVDALGKSAKAARTVSDRREELVHLLVKAGETTDTVNTLFAQNPNTGKQLASGLNQTFGSLSADAGTIPGSFAALYSSMRRIDSVFHWGPSGIMVWSAGITLTPFKPYGRSDCPRYGSLVGPSCYTAPPVGDVGLLPPQFWPRDPTIPPAPSPAPAPPVAADMLPPQLQSLLPAQLRSAPTPVPHPGKGRR